MDIISPAEQVSTELREQGQLEKALQKQIEFDRLIARISSRFIQLPWENLDQEINQSLQQMGKFLKVDTSYIFHYSEDGQTASMTHEWMSEGLSPQLNNQQNLPCAAFPWASATMGAGKTVVFSQLDELPPEATLDARNWRNLGVKSVLAFPLHSRQKVTGFVGFVSFKQEQIWTENMIQILQIFSEILSFMIQRQEAEKKLQLTEARYASLAESVPVGIFRTDAQGNCLYVNQRWCQMAGFGEELALGHGWLKALHPEDGDRIMSKWLSSIEEKKPFQEEYRFQRPDGKVVWVVGQALPEYDAIGEIDGYIGTITDISDRQQMAMSLQLSEEKLKEARQIAHLGSWELDLTTNNLIWSDECYHIFELDPQQFKPSYQTFLDIIHPEDRELVDRVYTESLKNRHPYSIIHRLQMKDGRLKYIQEQCHHYYDQAGNPLRSMGIVQDISQQKITEEILKDNEERLRLALKATNQGLYDLNVQTGKALVNDEYALMLGYNPSEFEETNAKWVERLHPDDQEVVANNYRAYVNNEIPEYKVEFRQRTKSGEWKWILSLGKIIAWDAQGQPLRMLGTHTDISKQKAVEEALQENKRQLSNLIDNLPGYVYRVKNDPNYTPLFISEGVYHITEYRQEEYLIEHTADSGKEIYPEDIDFLWQQIQQAVKNKQPFEFEYRIITKSGKIKWVWERGRGCWDDKGNLLYLEGFVTDVTARKEAQLALQKSYQEYNDLVNRIPVGVYKFHRSASGQLKFDYVSPQWCELNQISEEEIAQDINLFYQQVHPDDFGHLMELNQVAYETLEQFIWEGRLIINGEVR